MVIFPLKMKRSVLSLNFWSGLLLSTVNILNIISWSSFYGERNLRFSTATEAQTENIFLCRGKMAAYANQQWRLLNWALMNSQECLHIHLHILSHSFSCIIISKMYVDFLAQHKSWAFRTIHTLWNWAPCTCVLFVV